jgi:hypothetical protein
VSAACRIDVTARSLGRASHPDWSSSVNKTATTGSQPLIWPFFAWVVVGAGACVAMLSLPSIGVFVALPVIAAATLLLWWPRGRTIAMFGAVSGLGLVLLYVSYLNRGGPGDVCSATTTGQSCITEWSPWPWLVAGIALFALGVASYTLLLSRASR